MNSSYSKPAFWKRAKNRPFTNYLDGDRFVDCPREVIVPQSPSNIPYILAKPIEYEEVRQFLKQWFGKPPHTPVLEHPLSERGQVILYARDNRGNMIGVIRYRPIGVFVSSCVKPPLHIIDCFCIHPDWRKRGVGTYLLSVLHAYTNKMGMKWSIFLKEGGVVSNSGSNGPFYSSLYKYRQVCSDVCTPHTCQIGTADAHRRVGVYQTFHPDTFLSLNLQTRNQIWRVYRNGRHWMIAVFQDSFQIHPNNYGKIGWCTGVIESDGFPAELRLDAFSELSEIPEFSWIWADRVWTTDGGPWKLDGPFHWYSYQWSSSLYISRNYCIMT